VEMGLRSFVVQGLVLRLQSFFGFLKVLFLNNVSICFAIHESALDNVDLLIS
jgi:hypothetical protein